jgi:hypothetical protein
MLAILGGVLMVPTTYSLPTIQEEETAPVVVDKAEHAKSTSTNMDVLYVYVLLVYVWFCR